MENQENQSGLLQALYEFSKDSSPIKKGKKGYQYKYAPLEDMLDAIEENLLEHKLVVENSIRVLDGVDILHTQVKHLITKESSYSNCRLIYKQGDVKDYGASITYARRYNLSCLLNLRFNEGDPDDKQEDPKIKKTSKTRQPDADRGEMLKNIASIIKNAPNQDDVLKTLYKEFDIKMLKELQDLQLKLALHRTKELVEVQYA